MTRNRPTDANDGCPEPYRSRLVAGVSPGVRTET